MGSLEFKGKDRWDWTYLYSDSNIFSERFPHFSNLRKWKADRTVGPWWMLFSVSSDTASFGDWDMQGIILLASGITSFTKSTLDPGNLPLCLPHIGPSKLASESSSSWLLIRTYFEINTVPPLLIRAPHSCGIVCMKDKVYRTQWQLWSVERGSHILMVSLPPQVLDKTRGPLLLCMTSSPWCFWGVSAFVYAVLRTVTSCLLPPGS